MTDGRVGGSGRRHRIVMLLENFAYPADVRVRSEARSLVAAGHSVTVVAPRAPGQACRETVDGVRVRRFRVPRVGSSARATLLEYLVATTALHAAAFAELRKGLTVLHLHNPPDTLWPAGALARLLGRSVVYDSHDLFPELVEARIGPGPWKRAARLSERATFGVASHVLAANESHADVARGRGRVPPERVSVVRNGPPAAMIADAVDLRPGALADPHLVFVGMLASQDGGRLLPELLVRLAEDHGLPRARLTVIGDGDERAAIEGELTARGLADRARVTGWVGHEEVRRLVGTADICVDPALPTPLNSRSTMIKIAEYMAAAKPIVAFDLLETRRTAGGAALIADPASPSAMAAAVARLAADPGLRVALAASGLERVPALTWERSARVLLDAYARL